MNNLRQIYYLILILFIASRVTNFAQPSITQQPTDKTVLEGNTATFTIVAIGADTVIYQWYKDGGAISGADSSSYTTNPTVLADDGSFFYCVVTDSNGSLQSSNAQLTVTPGEAPTITQQPAPASQYVIEGQNVTLEVIASGTPALQYQWKKNNVNISEATDSVYAFSPTLADDGASYTCSITNNYGMASSDQVILHVSSASSRVTDGIQVLYEFEDQTGDIVQDVSGNSNPEDLTLITPEKTAWTPNGLEAFDGATIRRSVKDSKITQNCNASDEITVEVWVLPEWVTQNNGKVFSFCVSDQDGNFSIVANGDHYEFLLHTSTATDGNGARISSSPGTQKLGLTHIVFTKDNNETAKIYLNGILDTTETITGNILFSSSLYWLGVASAPYGGAYWRGVYYLAAVYDRALSDTEVAHNYSIGTPVDTKPAFTINPKDQYLIEGESLFMDSYAVSVQPIVYQWRKNGAFIDGQNNRFLNLNNITLADDGTIFTSTASSEGGHTISEEAILHVTPLGGRVSSNLQALYTFREGSGNTVNDVSGVGTPLNLNIYSTDSVKWESQGLRINGEPSIITTNSASKISNASMSSNEITIEAWLESANTAQASPSRIFTVSADENNRNFSLGQNNDAYEVNLRTTDNNSNGTPAISSSAGTVSSSGFDHVVFTRSSDGAVKFYINGTERVSTTLGGDFSNWNNIYLLSLGNEFGVDQHWLGLINLVAVYNRALSNNEVLMNYNFGPYGVVYRPTDVTLESNEIGKINISWTDNSHNEDGFIIERGTGNPVTFSQIDTVASDSTSYTDENISDNITYFYRVKGYYFLGESDYSDTLVVQSLIRPIEAPTGLDYSLNSEGHPVLTWNDNSDNETGFKIERRIVKVGTILEVIDSVDADVTSYTDNNVTDSTSYNYRVFAFNPNTVSDPSDERTVDVLVGVNENNKLPTEYSLSQNYPNPFNPTTTIKFSLPVKSNVQIIIYNMLGQKVADLLKGDISEGYHELPFNASSLTSGIYIYTITANGVDGKSFKNTKKMILMK